MIWAAAVVMTSDDDTGKRAAFIFASLTGIELDDVSAFFSNVKKEKEGGK